MASGNDNLRRLDADEISGLKLEELMNLAEMQQDDKQEPCESMVLARLRKRNLNLILDILKSKEVEAEEMENWAKKREKALRQNEASVQNILSQVEDCLFTLNHPYRKRVENESSSDEESDDADEGESFGANEEGNLAKKFMNWISSFSKKKDSPSKYLIEMEEQEKYKHLIRICQENAEFIETLIPLLREQSPYPQVGMEKNWKEEIKKLRDQLQKKYDKVRPKTDREKRKFRSVQYKAFSTHRSMLAARKAYNDLIFVKKLLSQSEGRARFRGQSREFRLRF